MFVYYEKSDVCTVRDNGVCSHFDWLLPAKMSFCSLSQKLLSLMLADIKI